MVVKGPVVLLSNGDMCVHYLVVGVMLKLHYKTLQLSVKPKFPACNTLQLALVGKKTLSLALSVMLFGLNNMGINIGMCW